MNFDISPNLTFETGSNVRAKKACISIVQVFGVAKIYSIYCSLLMGCASLCRLHLFRPDSMGGEGPGNTDDCVGRVEKTAIRPRQVPPYYILVCLLVS